MACKIIFLVSLFMLMNLAAFDCCTDCLWGKCPQGFKIVPGGSINTLEYLTFYFSSYRVLQQYEKKIWR